MCLYILLHIEVNLDLSNWLKLSTSLSFSVSCPILQTCVRSSLSLFLTLSHTNTKHTLSHTSLFFFLKKETASELLKGKTDCCLHTLSFSLTTPLTTVIDAASTTEFHKQRDCCKITWMNNGVATTVVNGWRCCCFCSSNCCSFFFN